MRHDKPMIYRLSTLIVLASLYLASSSAGQPFGYSVASDQLMRIDLSTGGFSLVATTGVDGIGGLTMAPDGNLLALDHGSDELWHIDSTDGTSTLIGSLGVAADPESALTLDACGSLWLTTNRAIYAVNQGTGSASFVNSLPEDVPGLTSDGSTLIGLGESPSQLATIDSDTGTVTRFGDFAGIASLEKGLDFDADGRLWGVFWENGPIPGPSVSVIVEFDPATGSVLSTLPVPQAQVQPVFNGNLAISPPRGVCSVPTDVPISAPALACFALLVGLFGIALIRR